MWGTVTTLRVLQVEVLSPHFQDPQSSTTLLERHSCRAMFTSGTWSSWAFHPWRTNRGPQTLIHPLASGLSDSGFLVMWSALPLQAGSFFFFLCSCGVHFPAWAEPTCALHTMSSQPGALSALHNSIPHTQTVSWFPSPNPGPWAA